ncbi:MAG: transglycosylase domain-containing protein [Acetobacteraceae bacterium]
MNRVYLGSGTWGVDAAARMYFGVSARKLNLWQCAVLAGFRARHPGSIPGLTRRRPQRGGRQVLAAMVETGVITAAQAKAASAQVAFPRASGPSAGWFAGWAAEQVQAMVPPGADAIVRTTAGLAAADGGRAAADGPAGWPGRQRERRPGRRRRSGCGERAVRAMVGGHDWRQGPYNRAVLARRQPGSSFKPFVWLAALGKGCTAG